MPEFAPVVLISAVFFAVNAGRLSRQPMWTDEALTVGAVSQLWHTITHDGGPTMALYYASMKPVVALTHEPAWVRLPSLVAATASIWFIYLIGRRIGGRSMGYLAIVVYAPGLMLSSWAVQARGYALSVLLVCVAWWALSVALAKGPAGVPSWTLVVYGAAGLSAPLAHGAAFVHLWAQFATLLLLPERWRWLRKLALVILLSVALTLLLALLADEVGGWSRPLDREHLRAFQRSFLGGRVRHEFLAAQLLLIGVCAVAARGFRSRGWDRWSASMLVVWAFSLPAFVLVSSIWMPNAVPRYAITALPGLALLTAYGLSVLRPRFVQVLFAGALVLMLLQSHEAFDRPTSAPWDEVADWVDTDAAGEKAGLLAASTGNRAPFDIAWALERRTSTLDAAYPAGEVGQPRQYYPVGEFADVAAALRGADHNTMYWVGRGRFNEVWEESGQSVDVAFVLERYEQFRNLFVARLVRVE